MTTLPGPEALLAALGATWPAARTWRAGPWQLRDGAGGGKRVSAASRAQELRETDMDSAIADGAAAMRASGQAPLFMIGPTDAALDQALAARGYTLCDPTLIHVARVRDIAQEPPPVTLFPLWPPLAIQADIWAEGGIGPARLAVMARAACPRTSFIARARDRVAGTGFAAISAGIAMLHAIEVAPRLRRAGVGRRIVTGAALWAAGHGAQWIALAVTEANAPARALYDDLGFTVGARYHYRTLPT